MTTNNYDQQTLVEQINSVTGDLGLNESVKKSYLSWIIRFLHFHNHLKPEDLEKSHVESYLTYLADKLNFQANTQIVAQNALIFFYQQFLNTTLGELHFPRLKQRRGFFSKFGKAQCQGVIKHLEGASKLMVLIAVECNLKLREVINLRLADIDLKQNHIVVRNTNGNKKFIANLPMHLNLEMRIQVMRVKRIVQMEKETQFGLANEELSLLANQLQPEWQYLFPHSFANRKKQAISRLNQTPLKLLKSDILLAVKKYNRFIPGQAKLAPLTYFKTLHKPCQQSQEPIKRLNHIRQTAFNFSDNLGAA